MNRIARLIIVILAVTSSSSCWIAAMVNSKPAASRPFADDEVPSGKGWWCFNRNDLRTTETICERTPDICNSSRRREQGGGSAVSVCEQRASASCYVVDTDPSQAAVLIPIGDKAKMVGCFGSDAECQAFRDPYAANSSTGGGVVAVSTCRTLD